MFHFLKAIKKHVKIATRYFRFALTGPIIFESIQQIEEIGVTSSGILKTVLIDFVDIVSISIQSGLFISEEIIEGPPNLV